MRRVVVTGLGLVSPLADGVESSWMRLINGHSGISNISHFDASDLPCKVAAEVKKFNPDASNAENENSFDWQKYLDKKQTRQMDDFIIFGMAAAIQAVEDSGWLPEDDEDRNMTGVLIGSGIGGLPAIEKNVKLMEESGPRRISPFFIPSCLINLVSGNLSIKYGFRGPNHSVVTACSTGAHAIGDAARLIKDGDADVMVAGGAEATICKVAMAGFSAARALSTHFNDEPTKASRPWDKDRDGFVMGEGAGVLVLEELEHAKKRGAKIYAEIVGYGLSGDGHHITAPHPLGGYRSMEMALRKAKINSDEIDYINAHGTSTPVGDENELNNVTKLFASSRDKVAMSSTKSSIGHLLGAAGSVEAIFSILAIKNSILPPTINLDSPIENCQINLVPNVAQEKNIDYALSNSFGFGGTNATLIMKKFQ